LIFNPRAQAHARPIIFLFLVGDWICLVRLADPSPHPLFTFSAASPVPIPPSILLVARLLAFFARRSDSFFLSFPIPSLPFCHRVPSPASFWGVPLLRLGVVFSFHPLIFLQPFLASYTFSRALDFWISLRLRPFLVNPSFLSLPPFLEMFPGRESV